MTIEDKVDDILEQTEIFGEMLEKAMGKKRFAKALKKIQDKRPQITDEELDELKEDLE